VSVSLRVGGDEAALEAPREILDALLEAAREEAGRIPREEAERILSALRGAWRKRLSLAAVG